MAWYQLPPVLGNSYIAKNTSISTVLYFYNSTISLFMNISVKGNFRKQHLSIYLVLRKELVVTSPLHLQCLLSSTQEDIL